MSQPDRAMQTEIARTDNEVSTNDTVRRAASTLQAGEVVALPTETVYGLGADALNPEAVEKIYTAKDRPYFDPLIIHVPHKTSLYEVAEVPAEISKTVIQLVETFWPGALTLVLPRKPIIPDIVTGGLPSVAVRQVNHPIFHRIVKNFGGPIAAPSANLFGLLSPTSCQAVEDQLGGRIPLIVDGGACGQGLESTIVKIEPGENKPVIRVLRPGPVTEVELKKFGKVIFADKNADVEESAPQAPGMLANHYAPRETPLRLLERPEDFAPQEGKTYALLSYRGQPKDGYVDLYDWDEVSVLSPGSGRVAEAGIRFFHVMRRLDMLDVDEIIAEPVPDRGVGKAILDKLRKAAVK